MDYHIEFNYKESNSSKYHFVLIIGKKSCAYRIYFYVLSDISGYGMDIDVITDPMDYIIFGAALIAEKNFMKNEIKKHFRD